MCGDPRTYGHMEASPARTERVTNSDQMYIGHKVEPGFDQTSAVIQWGDNDAPSAGPDVLKFQFAAGYSGGTDGYVALLLDGEPVVKGSYNPGPIAFSNGGHHA